MSSSVVRRPCTKTILKKILKRIERFSFERQKVSGVTLLSCTIGKNLRHENVTSL